MPRDTTPTQRPTCVARDGDIAHDRIACVACNAIDAYDAQRQRERDARRDAYLDAQSSMPITLALRAMRVPTSRYASSAYPQRPTPTYKPTRATLGTKGRPVPNEWESMGPHMNAHKAADPTCHHPLVKCAHKW